MRYRMMVPVLALACGAPGEDSTTEDDAATISAPITPAIAILHDTAGSEVGRVTLAQTDSGISVIGRIDGFAQGERGIHVHATGSCSPTFEAAGPHWNPADKSHGLDNPDGPHQGDLSNVAFQSDSSGQVDGFIRGAGLRSMGGLIDADGAAIVLHHSRDDQRTDPAGNSGARVACGVVE
ncbi:MAG TPA: superoxide dismutase family protein [Gemmatimonadales bacterium]|nr:superoxide dismutase family protein [Gemmatimonadales bacterium]